MRIPHRMVHDLSAYLDGELRPGEMAEVRRHLDGCADCRRELDDLRAVKRRLGRLSRPGVPPGFLPDLLARIERDAPGRRAWWVGPWGWRPRPAAALAAVALALVLVAVPAVRGHLDRLRAAEVGPDLFLRAATQAAADDPFIDRAFLGLVTTDANLILAGQDPRGIAR